MTDDRSLERAARSWLEAGPTQAPDRAVEAALLRIETTPQERDLRIPWRFPPMTTPARVAAAAVIGVLLVGGAFYYFGSPANRPSAGPDQSASTAASPVASASRRHRAGAVRLRRPAGLDRLRALRAGARRLDHAVDPTGARSGSSMPTASGLHELRPAARRGKASPTSRRTGPRSSSSSSTAPPRSGRLDRGRPAGAGVDGLRGASVWRARSDVLARWQACRIHAR